MTRPHALLRRQITCGLRGGMGRQGLRQHPYDPQQPPLGTVPSVLLGTLWNGESGRERGRRRPFLGGEARWLDCVESGGERASDRPVGHIIIFSYPTLLRRTHTSSSTHSTRWGRGISLLFLCWAYGRGRSLFPIFQARTGLHIPLGRRTR